MTRNKMKAMEQLRAIGCRCFERDGEMCVDAESQPQFACHLSGFVSESVNAILDKNGLCGDFSYGALVAYEK